MTETRTERGEWFEPERLARRVEDTLHRIQVRIASEFDPDRLRRLRAQEFAFTTVLSILRSK